MDRVACMLSGGLDSSSIACIAARLNQEKGDGPIHTFSNTYQNVPECDESPYIQSVLDQGGYQPHLRLVETRRSAANLEALIGMLGEPTHALGWFGGNGEIYPFMRGAGCSAVLDGHGGDEVLAEVNAIIEQLADQNRWIELALEYRHLVKANDMPFFRNYTRLVLSHGFPVRLKERWKLRTRLRRLRGQPAAPPPSVTPEWAVRLNPQFVVEMGLAARRASWRKTQPGAISDARAAHLHRLTHTGQSVAFEQIGRTAVRGGIEPSYPFWDKEMVEFCLRLPARFKLRRGFTRTVLRQSMHGILPDKVCRRRDKTDFAPQVVASLKSVDEHWMRGLLEDQTSGAELISSTWYHRVVSRLFEGERSLGEDLPHLCNCLSLLIWLRQHASS